MPRKIDICSNLVHIELRATMPIFTEIINFLEKTLITIPLSQPQSLNSCHYHGTIEVR